MPIAPPNPQLFPDTDPAGLNAAGYGVRIVHSDRSMWKWLVQDERWDFLGFYPEDHHNALRY